jgi:hypothetical protein
MKETLRQGPSIISLNQQVRNDLRRVTEQVPVLPAQHCQLELSRTALSQSQGPQTLNIQNEVKSTPKIMSGIQHSSGIISALLTNNLATTLPTSLQKDVQSRRAFDR